MNNLYRRLCESVMSTGFDREVRGTKSREHIAQRIIIPNPRYRIINLKHRKTNLRYAIAEFLFYMSGSNEISFLEHYAPSISKYSDDGKTFNSAYGHSILNRWGNQVGAVKEHFEKDRNTRRAAITIRGPEDNFLVDTNDSICTFDFHFLPNNNNTLDMIAHMRSNDLIVGFPNDIFCFTMFHEVMALFLGFDLGQYYHLANSIHIYSNHYEKAEKISKLPRGQSSIYMGEMTYEGESIFDDITAVLMFEHEIRNQPHFAPKIYEDLLTANISLYWKRIVGILLYKQLLDLKEIEMALMCEGLIGDMAKCLK